MPEPTTPAVAPSPEPTSPANPIVEPTVPVTPEPTTLNPTPASAPGTNAAPVTPSEPITPAEPVVPQAPSAPPTGEPTPPDPAAAPPEGDTRVVPKADGYTLPEGMPQELGQFANQNDMTQKQLDATLAQFGGYMSRTKKVEQLNLRKAGEEYIKTWGDNSKYNLSLAKRALKQNDPEGTMSKALNESGYGNHPAVLNFLYTIGKSMKEGGFIKSAVNRPPGKKTVAQSMYPDLPSEEQ